MSRLWFFLFLCWLLSTGADARSAIAGRVEVVATESHLLLRARVSVDQAFAAAGIDAEVEEVPGGVTALWEKHGRYLLAHLHVVADGQILTGRVVRVTPPATTAPEGRIGYDLQYEYPAGTHRPGVFELSQDVLREKGAGQPSEVTYVTLFRQGDAEPSDGEPLTSRSPVVFKTDWREEAQTSGFKPVEAVAPLPPVHPFSVLFAVALRGVFTTLPHWLLVAVLILAASSWRDWAQVMGVYLFASTAALSGVLLRWIPASAMVAPILLAGVVAVALLAFGWPRRAIGRGRLVVASAMGLMSGLNFGGQLLEIAGRGVPMAAGLAWVGAQLTVAGLVFMTLQLADRKRSRLPGAGWSPWRLTVLRGGSLLMAVAGAVYLYLSLRG